MPLWICLFLTWAMAHAQPTIMKAPRDLAMRQGAEVNSRILLFVRRGEKIAVLSEEGLYRRVKVKRDGKVLTGYVEWSALVAPAEKHMLYTTWGLGPGILYSQMSQSGKTFTTQDEVHYTTSQYTSTTVNPFLNAQIGRKDFWRVGMGWRKVEFKGRARTDIPGTLLRDVVVNYSMISFIVQKAWNVLWKPYYFGLGAEVARATGATVKLAGADLPTDNTQLPAYLGAHLFSGLEYPIGDRISLYGEGRMTVFANQAPPVLAVEAMLGGTWWF